MNEEQDGSNASHVTQRSPSFSKHEIETLIKLIEEHRNIILNKATNASTNHAKDITWNKIAKSYNSHGFKHIRSGEHLKTKWDNLKREARKLSKNSINIECNNSNYFLNQVLLMMASSTEVPVDVEINESEKGNLHPKFWEEDDKVSNHSNDGNDESEYNSKTNRSFNFSPQECSILLRCVKSEQRHVFSKETTGRAVRLKNNAWAKITHSFNKLSPQKRTTKVLRTKFNNMKKLTKNAILRDHHYNKLKKLEDEPHSKNIKTEPLFECGVDKESDSDMSDNENDLNEEYHIPDVEMDHSDPLSTILNGDSGIDSINNFGCLNQTQDKEISKLKLELLKYQLETAKLERQRTQEIIESDRSERETRAIEMSMRLRAARLELLAAEAKLPAQHPALQHHYTENKAKVYLQQFAVD